MRQNEHLFVRVAQEPDYATDLLLTAVEHGDLEDVRTALGLAGSREHDLVKVS